MATPTSIRLTGDLEEQVAARSTRYDGASTVIRRDLERYYKLVALADTGKAGESLTLEQGLVLVGERGAAPKRKRA